MRQIILDTETTGLEPTAGHRIIEIGGVELINRRLTGRHFHHYINPEREVEAGALAVHGISNDFLMDKPLFKQIAEEFIQFIQGAELIIHNAAFDVNFLNHELRALQAEFAPIEQYCTIIDTLQLARQLHPGQRNSLDALCKRYSIDNSHRDLHGALLDAEILASVYLAMTGGQGNLFSSDIIPNDNQCETASLSPIGNLQAELYVHHASPEEELAHQARLQAIAQAAPNGCLWLQLENSST